MDDRKLNIGLLERIRSNSVMSTQGPSHEETEHTDNGDFEDVIPETPSPVFRKTRPQSVQMMRSSHPMNSIRNHDSVSCGMLSLKNKKERRNAALTRLKAQQEKTRNQCISSSDEEEIKTHHLSSDSDSELEDVALTSSSYPVHNSTSMVESGHGNFSTVSTIDRPVSIKNMAEVEGKDIAVAESVSSDHLRGNAFHLSDQADRHPVKVGLRAICSQEEVLKSEGIPDGATHSHTPQDSVSDDMEDNISLSSFSYGVRKKTSSKIRCKEPENSCKLATAAKQSETLKIVHVPSIYIHSNQQEHTSLSPITDNTGSMIYDAETPVKQGTPSSPDLFLTPSTTVTGSINGTNSNLMTYPVNGRHINVVRYSAKWNKCMTAARQKHALSANNVNINVKENEDDDDFKLSPSQIEAQKRLDNMKSDGTEGDWGRRRKHGLCVVPLHKEVESQSCINSASSTSSSTRRQNDTIPNPAVSQGNGFSGSTSTSRPESERTEPNCATVRTTERGFRSAREELEVRNRSRKKGAAHGTSSTDMKKVKKRNLPSAVSLAESSKGREKATPKPVQAPQSIGSLNQEGACNVPEGPARNSAVSLPLNSVPTASTSTLGASIELDVVNLESPSAESGLEQRRRKRRRTASTARNIWAALTPVARGMSSRRHQASSDGRSADVQDEVILLSPDPVETINLIESDEAIARRLQEEMDMEYAASLAADSQQGNLAAHVGSTLSPSPPPLRGAGVVTSAAVNLHSPVRMRGTRVRNTRAPAVVSVGGNGARSRSSHIQDELNRLDDDVAMLMRIGAMPQHEYDIHRAAYLEQIYPNHPVERGSAFTVDEVQGMLDEEIMQYLQSRRNHRVNAVSGGRRGRGRQRASRAWLAAYGPSDGNDYEELLDLAERLGDVKKRGLSSAEISCLPTKHYSKTDEEEQRECHICMCDYIDGENLRILTCFHDFHAPCIDRWIKDNPTCPICRVEVQLH